MPVTESVNEKTVVIMLTGKIDFSTGRNFLSDIEKLKKTSPLHIIINFLNVTHIDSAGLGFVVLAQKNLEEAHIPLSIEVPEGDVYEVFQLTNLGQRIPITVITSETSSSSSLAVESPDLQELLLPILEKLEQKDLELPSLSAVASRVLTLMADPEANATQLTAVIQLDPLLTAKVFKLVNSAACGTHAEISSLSQAIAWLGLNSVAGLTLALSVQSGVFNDRGYKKETRSMWAHAIATGLYAKALAGMIGKNQDMAFLCGLLHSIGKFFVVHSVNEFRASSASRIPWSAMLTLMEQSYIEVGRQLAEAWNFPFPVKEAIKLHPHNSYHLAIDPSQGAALTCLAKQVASYHVDSVTVAPDMLNSLPVLTALQITHPMIDTLIESNSSIQAQLDSLLQ